MMSMDRERLVDQEGNLRVAVSTLQMVFAHPSFPREFVPPADWAEMIQLQPPEVFDQRFIEFIKRDKHPLAWGELKKIDPDIENTLRRQVKTCRARVDLEDPQNPSIIVRGTPAFYQTSAGDIFTTLAHEIGHLVSPEIEEMLPNEEAEHLRGQIREMEGGQNYDLSNLKLRRRGVFRFVTLEGKRLLMFPDFGKYYGTFLDEFYADIYKFYVFAYLVVMKSGVSLENVLHGMRSFLTVDAGVSKEAVYHLKLIDYAEKVGWSHLVRAGISSDVAAFLNRGTEFFGEEEHQKLLDELQTLRSSFSIMP